MLRLQEKNRSLIWLLGVSGALLIAVCPLTLRAAPDAGRERSPALFYRFDEASNKRLEAARGKLQDAVRQMEASLPLYDHHRVRTIESLKLGIQEINDGLEFTRQNKPPTAGKRPTPTQRLAAIPTKSAPGAPAYNAQQLKQSNAHIENARRMMAEARQALEQAANIYDGHKADALTLIGIAYQESGDALTYIKGVADKGKDPGKASDQLVREAGEYFTKANDLLRRTLPIYGEYRGRAIEVLQMAREEVGAAQAWAVRPGKPTAGRRPTPAKRVSSLTLPPKPPVRPTFTPEQFRESNARMEEARRAVEAGRAVLEKSKPNYDGHRADAIELAGIAIQSVNDALRYIDSNRKQ